MIKRCTTCDGAFVSVLRADMELLERCQALKQRSIAVMNFSLALVWRCLCGTNARFRSLPLRQRYSNDGFSGALLRQRPCFPHFVRGDKRCRIFVPSPYCSRNATTTFVWWDQGSNSEEKLEDTRFSHTCIRFISNTSLSNIFIATLIHKHIS